MKYENSRALGQMKCHRTLKAKGIGKILKKGKNYPIVNTDNGNYKVRGEKYRICVFSQDTSDVKETYTTYLTLLED